MRDAGNVTATSYHSNKASCQYSKVLKADSFHGTLGIFRHLFGNIENELSFFRRLVDID